MNDLLLNDISKKTKSKIRFIDGPNQFDLNEIENGLVAIHAKWSGDSLIYAKKILKILDESPRTDFEILILDIDKLTPSQQIDYLGFFSHGYFEGVWIENEKVICKNEYGKGIVSFHHFRDTIKILTTTTNDPQIICSKTDYNIKIINKNIKESVMKIIFLDIDGVLNSDFWEKTEAHINGTYPENMFDPNAINLLNKITKETSAKLVLTSTWRLKYSLDEMKKIFYKVGIKSDLIDFTPDLKKDNDYTLRGNEILKWCKDNRKVIGTKPLNYTDFIVLDDNNDMLLWQSKYFFQTDRLCGLSSTVTREAIRMLKN